MVVQSSEEYRWVVCKSCKQPVKIKRPEKTGFEIVLICNPAQSHSVHRIVHGTGRRGKRQIEDLLR